jgi:hypothetical protein
MGAGPQDNEVCHHHICMIAARLTLYSLLLSKPRMSRSAITSGKLTNPLREATSPSRTRRPGSVREALSLTSVHVLWYSMVDKTSWTRDPLAMSYRL